MWPFWCLALLLVAGPCQNFARTYQQILDSNDMTSFHFDIPTHSIFYDNNVLPDGHEVKAFLYKNQTKRYFFFLEKPFEALSITVIPCAAAVEWKVYFRRRVPVKEHFLDDPLGLQQGDARIPTKLTARERLLKRYRSRASKEFLAPRNLGIGTLEIQIHAIDRSSTIRLTAMSGSPNHFIVSPKLPDNNTVAAVQIRGGCAVLTWDKSPSEAIFGSRIEYCVAVTTKRRFRTLCAVYSALGDEDGIPIMPESSGFGFEWERQERKKMLRRQRRRRARQKNSAIKSREGDNFRFECIGLKNWYVLSGVPKGQRYFVDVYVVDTATNRSNTYDGATVFLPRNPMDDNENDPDKFRCR